MNGWPYLMLGLSKKKIWEKYLFKWFILCFLYKFCYGSSIYLIGDINFAQLSSMFIMHSSLAHPLGIDVLHFFHRNILFKFNVSQTCPSPGSCPLNLLAK